jgi:hypothetical protein
LAATSACSACSRSGALFEQGRRQAGRYRRQGKFIDRLATGDRTRIAADQDCQRVLVLRDLRFEQGNLRRRRFILRLRLHDVHLRHLAVLELQFEKPDRFTIGRQRLAGNLQLRVEAAQLQVAVGHRSDQRQDHAAPRLVGGQQVGQRRLGLAPNAAPEVDLPARRERRLVGRARVRVVAQQRGKRRFERALALAGGRIAELRKQWRARLCEQRRRLLDVGGGDRDVAVVRQSLDDQLIEHRVPELLPPPRVGGVGSVLRRVLERRRGIDWRAPVVGAHQAAGEQRGAGADEQTLHAWRPSGDDADAGSAASRGNASRRRSARRSKR